MKKSRTNTLRNIDFQNLSTISRIFSCIEQTRTYIVCAYGRIVVSQSVVERIKNIYFLLHQQTKFPENISAYHYLSSVIKRAVSAAAGVKNVNVSKTNSTFYRYANR